MVDKAQEEIKNITQNVLFQKADIRKKFIDRINENSLRTRQHFIDTYNQFLNKLLTSTLSELKKRVITIKNELISELTTEIYQSIRDSIKDYYSKKNLKPYTNFLRKSLNNINHLIDKSPECFIILNSRDYSYFTKNRDELKIQVKSKILLKEAEEDFIGGFKIIQSDEQIIYDYTIENLLNKNEILIQKEFTKYIDDSEIRIIQRHFENFIHNQKLGIKEHLKKYDQI